MSDSPEDYTPDTDLMILAYDQGKNEMLRHFKEPKTIYGSRTS